MPWKALIHANSSQGIHLLYTSSYSLFVMSSLDSKENVMLTKNFPPDAVEKDELQNEAAKSITRPSPFISLTWSEWFDLEARIIHFFGEFEYAAEHNQLKQLSDCALEIFTIATMLQIEVDLRHPPQPEPTEPEKPLMTREQMLACHERIFGRPPISRKALLWGCGR